MRRISDTISGGIRKRILWGLRGKSRRPLPRGFHSALSRPNRVPAILQKTGNILLEVPSARLDSHCDQRTNQVRILRSEGWLGRFGGPASCRNLFPHRRWPKALRGSEFRSAGSRRRCFRVIAVRPQVLLCCNAQQLSAYSQTPFEPNERTLKHSVHLQYPAHRYGPIAGFPPPQTRYLD